MPPPPVPVSRQDGAHLRNVCSSQNLDKDFIDDIICMHLLSENRNRNSFLVILETKDFQVYILGTDREDKYGMRSVTTENPQNLTRINALCGVKIRQFASGESHILALSEYGEVYAWGHNNSGQLGCKSMNMTRSSVPTIVSGLENQVVQQIECGAKFSVALTEEGKVFTWGDNSFGQTGHGATSGSTLSAKVVEGMLTDQKIVGIDTNWLSVLCLSVEGKVYGFGYNMHGNLGDDRSKDYHQYPVLARIQGDHKIREISCGSHHTLALTDKGVIFAWGGNSYGQVGGNSTEWLLPTRIKLKEDDNLTYKVTRIMAECNTSFAMDDKGHVYVWGSENRGGHVYVWGGENRGGPKKFEIAFPEPSNKLANLKTSKGVISDLLKSFDIEATSDLVITVEGKKIHVHKAILQIRSQYFANMLSGDWKESGTGEVVIGDHYSYAVYYEFLRYLYCGELRGLAPDDYLQLTGLARMTLDDHLAEMCARRIKRQLTPDNLLKIFSTALVLEEEELSNYCARWAVDKKCMKKIVGSGAYDEIPAEHVRKFFRKCSSNGAFELFDH